MHDGTYGEEAENEYQDVTYQSSRSHSLMLGMKEFSKDAMHVAYSDIFIF